MRAQWWLRQLFTLPRLFPLSKRILQEMEFIDTHVHLMMPEYDGILSDVITRAKQAGVGRFIVPGIDFKTSQEAVALAEKHSEIIPAIGLHPMGADEPLEQFRELAENPQVKAIGEIGMDRRAGDFSKQEKRFRFFLELAIKTGKPALIHLLHDWPPVLAIVKDYPELQGRAVWHCFASDRVAADELVELGMYLSCTAIVARKKMEATHEVIKTWPLEKTMLETDGPWLSWPKEDGPNEPTAIVKIAQLIADIKEMPIEEVAEKTTLSAITFFFTSLTQ